MLADMVCHRHQIRIMDAAADRAANFLGERRRHALIRIDLDDPVAATSIEARIAARAFELPSTLDDLGAEAARDLGRAISRTIEHHNDLVGETQPLQAGAELRLLVARDNDRGE